MLPCDTSHTNLGNPITSKPSIRSTNSTAAAKLDKHKPICSNLILKFNFRRFPAFGILMAGDKMIGGTNFA